MKHTIQILLLLLTIGVSLSFAKDKRPKLPHTTNTEAMRLALVSTIGEFQYGADTLITEFAEKYKDNPERLTAIAWAYSRFTLDDATVMKAYPYIDMALKADGKYLPAILLSAEIHEGFGEMLAADSCYLKAIATNPQDPEAYVRMATREADKGNSKESNAYYAKAKDLGMSPQHWVKYNTSLFMTGDVKGALEQADTSLMLYPEEKYLFRNKLYALSEMKRDSEAVSIGDSIVMAVNQHKIDSLNAFDAFYIGDSHLRLGHEAEAMTYFRQLYPKATTQLGYSLLKRMLAVRDEHIDSLKAAHDYDHAAVMYNRFIDIKPERHPSDYLLLANIFTEKASYIASDTITYPEADIRKVMKQEAYMQADSVYEQLPLKVETYDAADLGYRRGQALYLADMKDLARPQFATAISHYRGTTDDLERQKLGICLYYMTWIAYNDGDTDSAYNYAREALKYRPDDATMKQFVDYFKPKKKK